MNRRIFLALVHFPVLDRKGQVLASAVTNVDIHDLARSARTFGVQRVYIVTPVTLQQRMVEEVLDHWTKGDGAAHIRRAEALQRVAVAASLEAAAMDIAQRTGLAPVTAVTGAQMLTPTHSFAQMREELRRPDGPPILLAFGTSWGLAPQIIESAQIRLPPVGRDAALQGDEPRYNHLSVRAAVAIVLDRLLGDTV